MWTKQMCLTEMLRLYLCGRSVFNAKVLLLVSLSALQLAEFHESWLVRNTTRLSSDNNIYIANTINLHIINFLQKIDKIFEEFLSTVKRPKRSEKAKHFFRGRTKNKEAKIELFGLQETNLPTLLCLCLCVNTYPTPRGLILRLVAQSQEIWISENLRTRDQTGNFLL